MGPEEPDEDFQLLAEHGPCRLNFLFRNDTGSRNGYLRSANAIFIEHPSAFPAVILRGLLILPCYILKGLSFGTHESKSDALKTTVKTRRLPSRKFLTESFPFFFVCVGDDLDDFTPQDLMVLLE